MRTWDFIPSGAPVVEYIGVLSRDDELDNAIGNEYIFDIDCLHTIKGEGGREVKIQLLFYSKFKFIINITLVN